MAPKRPSTLFPAAPPARAVRRSRPSVRTVPAAAAAVAALALAGVLLAGCDDDRASHSREERTAAILALDAQSVVRVETGYADAVLVPSVDDSVRVLTVKRVQGMSQRSVDTQMEQIRVTMERAGNQLILRVREPERRGRMRIQAGPWTYRRSIEIEMTVAVPARAAIEWETARGDLTGRDLTQPLTARSASGDFEFTDLRGPVDVTTASGDLVLRGIQAAVSTRSTSGDVSAVEITGAVTARATSGDVSLSVIRGPVRVETSTGDVEVLDAEGSLRIGTSSGDVTAVARAETLLVETSSGEIDADLTSAPRSVLMRSSSGDVTLRLPPRSGGALDVQTASGAIQVRSALEVETMTRNRLVGQLGGAGQVQVRTSSGDIELASHDGR